MAIWGKLILQNTKKDDDTAEKTYKIPQGILHSICDNFQKKQKKFLVWNKLIVFEWDSSTIGKN